MLNEIDLSRADLNLLVIFDLVREERHVGRAAARLNLTASAVSHGLARLRRLMHDPLFLRTPKGVVPTARAEALAEPVAEILARARAVLASAAPFDPATSRRRFVVGAPDGVSAVFLPRLLEALRPAAPGVDIGVRQLLPAPGVMAPERAWDRELAVLEARGMDVAVIPHAPAAARFHARPLRAEDFVVAARAGHPFVASPELDAYCRAEHLVVSLTGDPQGFVDVALAGAGRSRRVALTVPNFMMALPVLAETDLIAALPRRFAALYAARFGLVAVEPPLPLPRFELAAVVPEVALMDEGLVWLLGLLG
jgi:DNA-binding transcriptional LysR family regulator